MATPPSGPAPTGHVVVLATWAQRALAFLLDAFLVLAIVGLLEQVLSAIFGDSLTFIAALIVVVTFVYFLGFAIAGTSPGKRALRLRLARTDGGRPNVAQAIVEAISKVAAMTIALGVVDVLGGMAIRRDRRQRLLQIASSTLVLFEMPTPQKRIVFVP
ncbi:MAG: RDD family protein [Thermoplasmatota archaeon]